MRAHCKDHKVKTFNFTKFIHALLEKNILVANLSLVFCSLLLLLLISQGLSPFLSSVEERAGSLTWTLSPDVSPEERLTIVAIDEKSLNAIGPWPWPRDQMARLAASIDAAGAQIQIHDIVYPAGFGFEDESLADALADRGLIAQLPLVGDAAEQIQSGLLTHPLTGVSCAETQQLPSTASFLGTSEVLARVPKGHITPKIDPDGSIRKIPSAICVEGLAYPALALSPFLEVAGRSADWSVSIEEGNGLLGPEKILAIDSYPGLEIPLDEAGNMRISFSRSPLAFRAVSAVDVIEGNIDQAMFDNVWVLVGATAFGLDDIVPTPYSGSAPGVELQARMIGSILDNRVPFKPTGSWFFVACFMALMTLVMLFVANKRGRVALVGLPVLALLSPVSALGLHGFFLTGYAVWVGWVIPGLFGLLTSMALLLGEHARVRFERSRVMLNLASYLPSGEAQRAALELPTSTIQAERCDVTLLYADLRNFSALGERRPPEESAAVLHYFFTKINEIAERNGGRVHEYKGDGVLVMWQGDGSLPAQSALATALEIDNEINSNLSQELSFDGLQPLAVGVGIEQGPVLMGSIGPAKRRAQALCGDTVSITLRIQEMTADLASPILIGEVAARFMSDTKLQSLGHYMLPGLVTSHALFTPSVVATNEIKSSLRLLKGGVA
jgi:CHASE2 domain-containing sensor protein